MRRIPTRVGFPAYLWIRAHPVELTWEALTAPYPAMNRICVKANSKPTFSAVCAYLTLDS